MAQQGIDISLKNGEPYHISAHAMDRMRERLNLKKSASIRLCKKALEQGDIIHQTEGNITIEYGNIQYVVCNRTVVTVYSRDMMFLRKKYLSDKAEVYRYRKQTKSKQNRNKGASMISETDIKRRTYNDTQRMADYIEKISAGKVEEKSGNKIKLQNDKNCRQNILRSIRNYLDNAVNTDGFWEEVEKIRKETGNET